MSNDYNVYYDGTDWISKRQGASRASSRHETQREAYGASRGYLGNSTGGDISVHRKDNNQIREKNTIGRRDSFPPKG